MREWVTVTIRCDNAEVRKQCALALMSCNVDQCVDWEEDYPEVGADMWEYIPTEEIESVSKRFPNDFIIYDYYYQLHGYTEYRSMTFLNGKGEHHKVKPTDYNCVFPVSLCSGRNGEAKRRAGLRGRTGLPQSCRIGGRQQRLIKMSEGQICQESLTRMLC